MVWKIAPRTTYSIQDKKKCYDKLYGRGVRRKSLWGISKVLTHDTKCTFHKRKKRKWVSLHFKLLL